MSMKETGFDDYGLVLPDDVVKGICAKIEGEYVEDIWEALEVVEYELGTEYCSEFTGEAIYINNDGTDSYFSKFSHSYDNDYIIYIAVKKRPSLFASAYSNIDEIVKEFEEKTNGLLPEDFNIRENIFHIVGTYLG